MFKTLTVKEAQILIRKLDRAIIDNMAMGQVAGVNDIRTMRYAIAIEINELHIELDKHIRGDYPLPIEHVAAIS
jgi:hypothetical protein